MAFFIRFYGMNTPFLPSRLTVFGIIIALLISIIKGL